MLGSSPLTRGKPDEAGDGGVVTGIIPAHAGKTSHGERAYKRPWDHPRSRGENTVGVGHSATSFGSSPLTRGKRESNLDDLRASGIIPAHAGKTTGKNGHSHKFRDHPRSRGENNVHAEASIRFEGSSPLTRGKPGLRCHEDFVPGIIPAHAGKTYRSGIAQRCSWDHPRSRGENPQLGFGTNVTEGSSPLTRGKREHGPAGCAGVGIIPAHAGKTSCRTPL